jgi:hypothetical protein
MGRPVALKGRPGGGGMGRPLELSGGRWLPSPLAPPRGVGRIVVGPSGETVRVGVGLGGTTRDRTTLGPLGTGSVAGASVVAVAESFSCAGAWATTGCAAAGAGAGAGVLVTRAGRGACSIGAAGAASTVAFAAFVAFVALSALAASAGTSRRNPSASARRRMRSA